MIKTTTELEKVLYMLKNNEATLFRAEQATLVIKQGKEKTGKPTGMKQLLIEYRQEKVD